MDDATTLGTSISLPEPPAGWFDYEYAVLMDGSLAVLRTDLDIHTEHALWRAQVERDIHAPPPKLWGGRARLSTFDGVTESKAINVPLGLAPVVDRLADGRWLLAATRATHGETNAHLYAPDGTPAGAFAMGDGISFVRCAPDGTVWVGYFDEGIGSLPNDDGNLTISSAGITHIAPDGTVLWRFDSKERADLIIADCYSLTLNGNTAWSSFYTGFPIVRIENGVVRHWRNGVTGAQALAIDVDHIVLAGGYDAEAKRIALLRLDGEQAQKIGELHFQPRQRGVAGLVQGLGATLHIVGGGYWTKLTVATVRAALSA